MNKTIPTIELCIGSSCFARGNAANIELVNQYLADHGLKDEVDVILSGSLCTGQCPRGPIVLVNGKTVANVDQGVMLDILNDLFNSNENSTDKSEDNTAVDNNSTDNNSTDNNSTDNNSSDNIDISVSDK